MKLYHGFSCLFCPRAAGPGAKPGPTHALLFSKNADTAIAALGGTNSTRLQGHKRVVVAGIDRDTVRVRIGRDIFQPGIRLGVDDAHDRAIRHISRCHVVAVVARVVPGFVNAADVGDFADDRARRAVDDEQVRWESFAVMIAASDEEVIAWTLNDAGGHAILHHEAVDDDGPIGVSEPGIDFIDASDVGDTDGISVRLQQVTGIGIPGHSTQAGQCYRARTICTWRSLATECPQGLVDDRSVVAGDCVKRTARRYSESRKSQRTVRRYRSRDSAEDMRAGRIRAGESGADGVHWYGLVKANSP